MMAMVMMIPEQTYLNKVDKHTNRHIIGYFSKFESILSALCSAHPRDSRAPYFHFILTNTLDRSTNNFV